MKTIIIANGAPPSKKLITTELTENATLIAADGGANILFQYQILPQHIIGDLDSISKQALLFFQSRKVNIEQHPCEKSATDLELAFNKAQQLGAKEIILLGAIGRRIDHMLGNIGILLKAVQQNIIATIKDEQHIIQLLTKSTTITGQINTTFSLQAYAAKVTNLNISGSKYELSNYDLLPGDGRTISNEFLTKPVEISFSAGKPLLIINNNV